MHEVTDWWITLLISIFVQVLYSFGCWGLAEEIGAHEIKRAEIERILVQFSYRVKIKGVVCGDVFGEFGWGLIELSLLFKFILVRNVDEFCRLRVRHQGAALARPNPRDYAPCLLSSLRCADLPMIDPYHILQLLTFHPLLYSYNREHDHLFWNDISSSQISWNVDYMHHDYS